MKQSLTHITIIVDDYDKAIEFYTKKLHFTYYITTHSSLIITSFLPCLFEPI
jgi:predicted enzyme related to lactoylglutathione lyase